MRCSVRYFKKNIKVFCVRSTYGSDSVKAFNTRTYSPPATGFRLLCPAPSTHKFVFGLFASSNSLSPCQNGITRLAGRELSAPDNEPV